MTSVSSRDAVCNQSKSSVCSRAGIDSTRAASSPVGVHGQNLRVQSWASDLGTSESAPEVLSLDEGALLGEGLTQMEEFRFEGWLDGAVMDQWSGLYVQYWRCCSGLLCWRSWADLKSPETTGWSTIWPSPVVMTYGSNPKEQIMDLSAWNVLLLLGGWTLS